MERLFTSLLIALCVFLGNFSGQVKSYKIVGHISSEHSGQVKNFHHHHSHDHHEHKHVHKHARKKNSPNHHHHSTELSFVTVHLAVEAKNIVAYTIPSTFLVSTDFLDVNEIGLLSFSPNIFRPPIA